MEQNPLLNAQDLPAFSKIKPTHIKPAIESILTESRNRIEELLQQTNFTWQSFIEPLNDLNEKLQRAWSPVAHLNSVKNSPELREAFEACLPLLAEYSTWLGQNKKLYQAYLNLRNSSEYANYSSAQKKAIANALRDFELSGIALDPTKQARYGEIVTRLSELSSKFSNNVLDATMGFEKIITDESLLKGLPESALQASKISAQSKNLEGYRFTLEHPSYLPIMLYAENQSLREEMYRAFNTRASDQGVNAGKWDNSEIMQEILTLRFELAQLLGFASYTEYSLATKMANHPRQVLDFLENLAQRAKPQAERELTSLKEFCQTNYGVNELQLWDISFYSEKQKQALYDINDEQLRPYFPENKVLSGLFELVHRLFNIKVKERKGVDTWHSDVRFFDLLTSQGDLIGSFYLDLYAREHKRGGAWMDDCIGRRVLANSEVQRPVAYLTCNFNAPVGDQPALFTHNEVTTLFHEFGHGIHHLLTQVNVPDVAGINGVPWDAVELPSQFLENWCWQPQALEFISGHYQSGEPLPADLLEKLIASKNFQAAMFMVRQLEFGLFDFRLHHNINPNNSNQVIETLRAVKDEVAVLKGADWGRMPHAFGHIFAGGYSAGYYSYLWAEVLSADAFARFEEEGIFNPTTGQDYLQEILSQGGSAEPMELFVNFRGREPSINALLRHKGICG